MATVDLTPAPTVLVIAEGNDKVISVGPTKIGGVVTSRAGKQLRCVVKATDRTPDADAVVDFNSVDDDDKVFGVGEDATGMWAVDLRNNLPAVGSWHLRIDLTDVASLDTDREIVALVVLHVRAV